MIKRIICSSGFTLLCNNPGYIVRLMLIKSGTVTSRKIATQNTLDGPNFWTAEKTPCAVGTVKR
jgi:hypothetical protein